MTVPKPLTITTQDGFPIEARLFDSSNKAMAVVSPAMGVPGRFYRHLAAFLAAVGITTITYDYRGVGESRSIHPRDLDTNIATWALQDMAAVVEYAAGLGDGVHLIGHSLGGQLAGLLPNTHSIESLVSVVGQSGHWRLQGGRQQLPVALHGYVSLPLLSRLFGYGPFKMISLGEDVPVGVALQWARWIRHPDYLFGDDSLPLERYAAFDLPVLAYSIDDDDWGSATSVDNLMLRYPNVDRRHMIPSEYGLKSIGHVGAFRQGAESIWKEIAEWIHTH